MKRPGYLGYLDEGGGFMTPMIFWQRWKETPCQTPWLFYSDTGVTTPRTRPESCANYQMYNLGQWITSDPSQCILGKELSQADTCKPYFRLCGPGYDWVSEVGCVRQQLRT